MNQALKLVTVPRSPYGVKVAALLYHKQIPFDFKFVELDDDLLKQTPLWQVPLLYVGDTLLYGSNVLLEYIDSLSQPRLFPTDPLQQAQHRQQLDFSNSLTASSINLFKVPTQQTLDTQIDDLQWHLATLESWLKHEFINSNKPTLPDFGFIATFIVLKAIQKQTGDLVNKFPKTQEYAQRLLELPALQQALPIDYSELILWRAKQLNGFITKQ